MSGFEIEVSIRITSVVCVINEAYINEPDWEDNC